MNRLKTLRLAKGLTQKELSEKLNINQGNYSKYEKGTLVPTMETVLNLSDYYNVSIDYLLGKDSKNDDIKMQLDLIIDYIKELKKTL